LKWPTSEETIDDYNHRARILLFTASVGIMLWLVNLNF